MSDERNLQTEQSEEEQSRTALQTLSTVVNQALEAREAQLVEQFAAKISELSQPQRTVDPTPAPERSPEKAQLRPRHNGNLDTLYRSLPENEQKWRGVDADHWYRHYFWALLNNDRAGVMQAHVELEGIFGRAEILEGAPDSGGGIGAGTGAELLPHPLGQVVLTARDRVNKIRRFAMPIQLTTQTLQVPTMGAVTSYMTAEGAVATQGEPDPSAVLFRANKAQAYGVASKEFVADSAFNVVNLLAVRAGRSLGALEDTQAATSNGSAPNISAALAGQNVDETTSTELSLADLRTLYFSVPQAYRDGAIFLASGTTLSGMSGMSDTSGRALIPGLLAPASVVTDDMNSVGTIFGKPAYEFPLADGTIFFGNVQAGYAFGQRSGLEAEVSREVLFASDKVAFKFTERIDGNVVDNAGMFQIAAIATYNDAS